MTTTSTRSYLFSLCVTLLLFAGSLISADTLFAPPGLFTGDIDTSVKLFKNFNPTATGGISSDLQRFNEVKKQMRVTYSLENAIPQSDSITLQTGTDSLHSLLSKISGITTPHQTVTFTLSNKFKPGNPKRILITDTNDADSTLLKKTRSVFKSLHFKGNAVYGQTITLYLLNNPAR